MRMEVVFNGGSIKMKRNNLGNYNVNQWKKILNLKC